jgi:hypothetical protein
MGRTSPGNFLSSLIWRSHGYNKSYIFIPSPLILFQVIKTAYFKILTIINLLSYNFYRWLACESFFCGHIKVVNKNDDSRFAIFWSESLFTSFCAHFCFNLLLYLVAACFSWKSGYKACKIRIAKIFIDFVYNGHSLAGTSRTN